MEGEQLPTSISLQKLFAWAELHGVLWSKLVYPVRFNPGYIGTQATEEIGPNETIISVPQKLLLTANIVETSELREVILQHPELFSRQHPWHEDLRLIAYLLHEKAKGERSFWAPFFAVLPQDCDSVLAWSDAELAELQDDYLVRDIQDRRKELQSHWNTFSEALIAYPHLFPPAQLSIEQFSWAHWIISSRSFGKSVPCTTLCPVAELLNHSLVSTYYVYGSPTLLQPHLLPKQDADDLPRDLQLFWPVSYELLILAAKVTQSLPTAAYLSLSQKARKLDTERYTSMRAAAWKAPELETTEDTVLRIVTGPEETYKQGTEVYLNYGAYSNRQLLLYYGFVLPSNPYNYEYVVVPLESILSGSKLTYLRDFQSTEQWGFKVKEREICMSLIRTLRAVLWQGSNLEACFRPVDLELESLVLSKAAALLSQAQFPTTIEQDQVLLEGNTSLRVQFALQYRHQRKLILIDQIRMLSLLQSHIIALQSGQSPAQSLPSLQPYLLEL
jgi:hypothetical protein